ncbi:MAG: CDF family Co(II)/Ni(II) efflux transporter DmeF [Deltaproteobacteria bacterium]|nr:CDF family Co(II)/Ni(II) efflux transporter DmeF [Deltaproteobacteria bacterium]
MSSDRHKVHSHALPALARSEQRTRVVVLMTLVTMVVEIAVGLWTNSLALLADGWHMATHAGALGLSAWAYWYARKNAGASRYSFGTGKLFALVGYTNALVLVLVALAMIGSAIDRMLHPQAVAFDEALIVAVIGLAVNLVSARVLDAPHDHDDHDHDHHHDHNLRSAYLHVLADALTSIFAIAALVAGKWFGLTVVDPLCALVASAVILKWGVSLCRSASAQLLDADPMPERSEAIRKRLEQMSDVAVVDLHLWQIGPAQRGCIVSIVAKDPRPLSVYRDAVLEVVPITHLTIEVEHPH